ncbi:MAG: Fur family transcriptional regulator [Cypionkella sp.]|nr:Fur family transcriptional regulator [Cypionkella sp.]
MTKPDRQREKLERALHTAGLRVTTQRIAMLRVMTEAEDHPDVAELHRRAQAHDPAISVATAYRTIAALDAAGLVQRHSFDGASARYERVDKLHHDHIVDLDTGDIVEFQSDAIERLQSEIAAKLGYEVVHHRLELYCRKRSEP